jgi:hypothetical protein
LPASVLGTLLPPMLCLEHCFLACFYARNTASSYALLRTLLLCSARNIASLHITVCFIILYPPRFFLEIRVIIKILKNPWYPINCD